MFRYRLLILNGILLLTLGISHWGRNIEDYTLNHPDFLQRIPLPFRDWTAAEEYLTAPEQSMLQPDATLLRTYKSSQNDAVQIAVIVGHRKRSIHTPGFCMAGGGWTTVWQQQPEILLQGRKVRVLRTLMMRDRDQLLVTYFFTDGDYSTSNLVQFQGEQLIKRLHSEVPLGALIRILTPVRGNPADAEKLSDAFTQAVVPPILQELRRLRLHPD